MAPPTRRARATAVAFDLAMGVLLLVLTALAALLWLLFRTEGGRFDVALVDGPVAAATLLASVPAWYALLAVDLALLGATPGQRFAGLRVVGRRWRRLVRLALHPLAVAPWTWATVVAAIASWPDVALACASVGVTLLGAGLVSQAVVAWRPEARAVHDLVAGTRLVRA